MSDPINELLRLLSAVQYNLGIAIGKSAVDAECYRTKPLLSALKKARDLEHSIRRIKYLNPPATPVQKDENGRT